MAKGRRFVEINWSGTGRLLCMRLRRHSHVRAGQKTGPTRLDDGGLGRGLTLCKQTF